MTNDNRDNARRADYRIARIAVAVVLGVVLSAIVLIDALSPEYEAQPTTLGLLGTIIVVLLGLEIPSLMGKD